MKISKFLASFFVLVTSTVFANGTYLTQIESLNRVGRSVNWDIELILNQKEFLNIMPNIFKFILENLYILNNNDIYNIK